MKSFVMGALVTGMLWGTACAAARGDACFLPADMPHTFTPVSEEPVRVLVIYTPPYGEKGAVTHPSA